MRTWEVRAERGYYQLRESRPPFVTEYERNQILWQRRDRMILTTLALLATSVVAFALHWAM